MMWIYGAGTIACLINTGISLGRGADAFGWIVAALFALSGLVREIGALDETEANDE